MRNELPGVGHTHKWEIVSVLCCWNCHDGWGCLCRGPVPAKRKELLGRVCTHTGKHVMLMSCCEAGASMGRATLCLACSDGEGPLVNRTSACWEERAPGACFCVQLPGWSKIGLRRLGDLPLPI